MKSVKTVTNTNVTKDSSWMGTKTPSATQARANGIQCHFVKKKLKSVCKIINNFDETMNNKIYFISVDKCSPLDPPVNGKWEVNPNWYRLKCDQGFVLNGFEYVTCNLRTGRWSAIPTCEKVEIPVMPTEPSSTVTTSEISTMTTVKVLEHSSTTEEATIPAESVDVNKPTESTESSSSTVEAMEFSTMTTVEYVEHTTTTEKAMIPAEPVDKNEPMEPTESSSSTIGVVEHTTTTEQAMVPLKSVDEDEPKKPTESSGTATAVTGQFTAREESMVQAQSSSANSVTEITSPAIILNLIVVYFLCV